MLDRPGHTEAAVDLCRLAGLAPVGAIGELVNDDGTMMRLPQVLRRADEPRPAGHHHRAADRLAAAPRPRAPGCAETTLPTAARHVRGHRLPRPAHRRRARRAGSPRGHGAEPAGAAALRVPHRRRFGSLRCDCGPQLRRPWSGSRPRAAWSSTCAGTRAAAIGLLRQAAGVRPAGRGLDTVDAQVELGLPVDAREYAAGAAILTDLGRQSVRLLTNNPAKVDAMREHGIEVAGGRARSAIAPVATTRATCATKRDRWGTTWSSEAARTGRASA